MTAKNYLEYIVREIHTTIVATVDDEGLPVTAAIDMMAADEHGLYFLTAKGKGFYDRLVKRQYLALTALKVRELGNERIPELFEMNPYMKEIYPTEKSMQALTVFQIYEGSGECFDLSKKPIERASFIFGGAEKRAEGYFITDACIGCGSCAAVCPQNCILTERIPYVISQEHCLHCGNCLTACPVGAVETSRTGRKCKGYAGL